MERCTQTANDASMPARTFALRGSAMSILACAIAACGAEPSVATSNAVGTTTVSVSAPAVPPAQHALKLAGQADGTAVAATLAETRRQKLTDVEISKAQSFRVVDGARQVATVLTGHGDMPDAIAAGCFIAIHQRGDVELIPDAGLRQLRSRNLRRAVGCRHRIERAGPFRDRLPRLFARGQNQRPDGGGMEPQRQHAADRRRPVDQSSRWGCDQYRSHATPDRSTIDS
jgi:hypothetical protein